LQAKLELSGNSEKEVTGQIEPEIIVSCGLYQLLEWF